VISKEKKEKLLQELFWLSNRERAQT